MNNYEAATVLWKVVTGPTALFITLGGPLCVRENRRQNESRRGRLNLAQDAVLGRNSKDEKSLRDDWQLPEGDPQSASSKIFRN